MKLIFTIALILTTTLNAQSAILDNGNAIDGVVLSQNDQFVTMRVNGGIVMLPSDTVNVVRGGTMTVDDIVASEVASIDRLAAANAQQRERRMQERLWVRDSYRYQQMAWRLDRSVRRPRFLIRDTGFGQCFNPVVGVSRLSRNAFYTR